MLSAGQTRTVVQLNHAFIAPDGHVWGTLPGWEGAGTQGAILISPHLQGRPRFTQYLVRLAAGSCSGNPLPGVQRFAYVVSGQVRLTINSEEQILTAGCYAYLPADTPHRFYVEAGAATLLIFEKRYVVSPLAEAHQPTAYIGNAWASEGEPFMGDESARLRVLLPATLAYDMAINLFTFQPGAALPFVETHIMEHGLYLLEGQGVYRLDNSWYPIQAGDSIWMGPYCPQWFCAIGKSQSSYLYYKDINRDPLS
jgi:(S)-ureidoglycine aminohydrolase